MDIGVVIIASVFVGFILFALVLGFILMWWMNYEENKGVPKIIEKKTRRNNISLPPIDSKKTELEETQSSQTLQAEEPIEEEEPKEKEEEIIREVVGVKQATNIPTGKGRILLLTTGEWLLETAAKRYIHSAVGKFRKPSDNIEKRIEANRSTLKKGAPIKYGRLPVGSMFQTRQGRFGMKGANQAWDLQTGHPFGLKRGGKTPVRSVKLLRKN